MLKLRNFSGYKSFSPRRFSSVRVNPDSLKWSIFEAKQNLDSKTISAEELISACINQMNLHSSHNAFITRVNDDALLQQARESDKKRAQSKDIGLLEGIPLCIKDNFCTSGIKTTCNSKMLENFTPPYSSTVFDKLLQHGSIITGKTNMDEFGMGSSSTNGYSGPVINPWSTPQTQFSAGGSSGGSAAAVAAHMAFGGIGSDTGGSVRQPAAFCGIVGLKPTYGRVSRHGLIAYGSSLDCPGIFARDVRDTALILEAIAGYDPKDSTSLSAPVPSYTQSLSKRKDLKGITVGIPKEYYVKELSSEIHQLWKEGARQLEAAGANVIEISLPNTQHALPAYYIIAPAEAYSNLARYDGVKYGYRSSDNSHNTTTGDDIVTTATQVRKASSLEEMYSKTRTEAFGEEVQRRLLVGSFVLSRKSAESYYIKAQQVRRLIADDFSTNFHNGVDVILTPTTPTAAFPLSTSASPVEMYINDVMTIPASLAGLPAISIPVKKSEKEQLPLGLQLIGPSLGEADLLSIAQFLENKV